MDPGRASILVLIAAAAVLVAGALAFLGGDDDAEGSVVYHGNGGLTADGSDTCEVHGDTVSANSFVSGNELFASWNTAANGSWKLFNAGDRIDSAGGIDLYAQWGVTASFAGTEDRNGIRFYIAESLGSSNHTSGRTAPYRSRTTGARPS